MPPVTAKLASWHMIKSSNVETLSVLLALCAGNSPVTGEFLAQRPVTRSFDVFFDLRPNKRLSKQSWGWWFEMPSCPLWRHCNESRFSGTHLPVYFLDISILHLLFPWYLLTPTTNWHAWKRFSHYWPFVRGILRSPMNFFQKGLVIRKSDIRWC